MAILKEYNEISDRFAEPMEDDEMTQATGAAEDDGGVDAVDGWNRSCLSVFAAERACCSPKDRR